MRKQRQSFQSSAARRDRAEAQKGWIKIGGVAVAVALIGSALFFVSRGYRALDSETQCPATPSSITVLLVDVTDPMSVAQRQDFQNQLASLRNAIPRYGKLVVAKVDSTSSNLLRPVIIRCNPGTAADTNEWSGNPQAAERRYREKFEQPLDDAFQRLATANGSERSPILESVQSVALTELLTPSGKDLPRTLILVSDLLQNTEAVSFYSGLPNADDLVASSAFRRSRADLREVEIEVWMLERVDSPQTQPRALIDLWERIFGEQDGVVTRVYNVSG